MEGNFCCNSHQITRLASRQSVYKPGQQEYPLVGRRVLCGVFWPCKRLQAISCTNMIKKIWFPHSLPRIWQNTSGLPGNMRK